MNEPAQGHNTRGQSDQSDEIHPRPEVLIAQFWMISACHSGTLEEVINLMKAGATVNPVVRGSTPLHAAIMGRNQDIALFLMEQGADVNARTIESLGNNTPLHIAAQFMNARMVAELLGHGADPTLLNKQRETCLVRACRLRKEDMVRVLLQYPNAVNVEGCEKSPLIAAVEGGSEAIVDLLLQHGVHVAITGDTPLHVAIDAQRYNIVWKLLRSCPFDLNSCDSTGRSPLHVAMHQGAHAGLIKYLQNAGSDVDAKDVYGETMLIKAGRKDDLYLVEELATLGADIFAPTRTGTPLIHELLMMKHDQVVVILIHELVDRLRDKGVEGQDISNLACLTLGTLSAFNMASRQWLMVLLLDLNTELVGGPVSFTLTRYRLQRYEE